MQMDTTNDALRHPTLYKASGDLVISAADGVATHLFRVHALILAEHSPIFAGMLSLPTGAQADVDTYDGVPVVHLPDNAKDVASMLEVIYTPGHPILEKTRNFAADAYGLMSIATKYELDSICAAISMRLKEQWPASREEFVLSREDKHRLSVGPIFGTRRSIPEPAAAIRLATDFNIPEVLTAAYYELATCDIIRDIPWAADFQAPRWYLLRPEELLRYYQGKHRLTREFARLVSIFDNHYDEDCESIDDDFDYDSGEYSDSSECRKALAEKRKNWNNGFPSFDVSHIILMTADPVHALVEIYDGRLDHKLCTPCARDFRLRCQEAVESLWDELPAIFSLKDYPIYAPGPHAQKD